MANGHATQPEQPDSLLVESAAELIEDLRLTVVQPALGWQWPEFGLALCATKHHRTTDNCVRPIGPS